LAFAERVARTWLNLRDIVPALTAFPVDDSVVDPGYDLVKSLPQPFLDKQRLSPSP
jgi:hypothetical protein